LGVKFEGAGVRVRTEAGGKTEMFGMFNYGPGLTADDRRPAIDIDNASFSLAGIRELNFAGYPYTVKVREARGTEVRTVEQVSWIGWSLFSGWQ
jgi:hypothetical protein